jgi:threonine aldolase
MSPPRNNTFASFFCSGWPMLVLALSHQPIAQGWAVLAPPSAVSRRQRQASTRPTDTEKQVISLQDPHLRDPPAVVFRRLAEVCEEQGIDTWDVYGDFPNAKPTTTSQREELTKSQKMEAQDYTEGTASSNNSDIPIKECAEEEPLDPSFLRRFEKEIAQEVGKEDAVFMPSGVMAQSIALLVHQQAKKKQVAADAGKYFICHETSHLLLHEQDGYDALLQMRPISVSTRQEANEDGLNVPAMGFSHVLETLTDLQWSESVLSNNVAALFVELPHRELGGKITPWEDLVRLTDWCSNRKIPTHCDGARLFESTVAYDGRSPAELTSLFDSVYLSFYKGLGGMSGAMLCGSNEFCAQARIWLRRFGGNLYTLTPYAVSAYDGYQRNWKETLSIETDEEDEESYVEEDESLSSEKTNASYRISFHEQRNRLREIVAKLSGEESLIPRLVTFDPAVPVTNMVHGYLRCTADEGMEWCRWITAATGVQVLRRIRPLTDHESLAWKAGYRSMFEWTMGNANGQIPEDVFYEGWKALAETYVANDVALENGESPIEYKDDEEEEEERKDALTINEEESTRDEAAYK